MLTLRDVRLPGRSGRHEVVIASGLIESVRPLAAGETGSDQPVGDLTTGLRDHPGAGLTAQSGPVLNGDGRWLLPGFWDEHVHFRLWSELSRRLDVSQAASAAEVVDLVRAGLPAGASQLIAAGFRDGLWPDAPRRELLDAVTEAEVYVVSADLHSIWLNSPALARFGWADHPTGLLREQDCFRVTWALSDVSTEVSDDWVGQAAQKAAARGVVGLVDLDLTWSVDDWRRRAERGFDQVRVSCGVFMDFLDQAVAEGLKGGAPIDQSGLIRVGPLKIVTDGSLNTRTAWCFDPYPGLSGDQAWGRPSLSAPELVDLMERGWRQGLRPAVHAIGDQANAVALDAFEQVGCPGRIEHAQLLRWQDIPRLAELGLIASVQPEHAMDDRDVADRHWAGRTDRAFANRSLLDGGVRLALGSDAPVAPLDPWITVAAAVHRGRAGREPWHQEQAIPRAAALAASARGRAVVAPGQPADLQLIELDPLAAPPDHLRTMPVAATWLAGRPTHGA
ncbi:MAG: amidohydrolase family protein [Propionibacteriaceae bacterium]|jgi:predicted amidohydrolase YtcJ|nr:amidohydrolase family protein [Propionibacteriaceae bacterium]